MPGVDGVEFGVGGFELAGLHPILVQIGKVHTAEEARHISYARSWLENGIGKLTADQRAEVQRTTRENAQPLIGGKIEQLILDGLRHLFDAERDFTRDWIASHY